MRDKINHEIDYIEFEINELLPQIDREVARFKEWVAKCDAYHIASLPYDSEFQHIQSDCARLGQLRERKRWLVTLLKEE